MLKKNKKIGLVLGSGAAKGLAHIGVLKVLDELGIKPDIITGTSIGALIGALYASGLKAKEIEIIAKAINKKQAKQLFKVSLNGAGFSEGKNINKMLNSILLKKNIGEFDIPFACVACNIIDGREIVFEKGDAIQAIRASISVPVLLTPQKFNNNVLVDGGLVNPVPVDIARRMGADYIIAVNVLKPPVLKHKKLSYPKYKYKKKDIKQEVDIDNFNNKLKTFLIKEFDEMETLAGRIGRFFDINKKINIIDIITQTFYLGEANLAKNKLEADKPDLLIEPDTTIIKHLEFHKALEGILIGEKEMWKNIAKLKINEK